MMRRQVLKLIIFAFIAGIMWLVGKPTGEPSGAPTPISGARGTIVMPNGSARETWGRPETLDDHFARHGGDFHARDAEDYATQAHAFLERAKTSGLPAKWTADGTLRIYDPDSGTFAAYNANGTTKTFFKPGNPSYFEHQPGERIDLRTRR
jgi:hypothetical protein